MSNLDIYCVTNEKLSFLEKTPLKLVGVGKEKFSEKYLKCDNKKNIYDREKFYSELTFHYWYWQNCLQNENKDWIGFCQKRRFWIKKTSIGQPIDVENFENHFLSDPPKEWNNFDAIICDPISVNKIKKMKLIKRGYKSLIKDPSILFDTNKQTINLHFDMHHGYGNLNKAINLIDVEDKNEFLNFVNTSTFYNPHLMFITKPQIMNRWFSALFPWLFRCENVFGFKKLKGYDTQRLYAYLAERYLSFWFNKYTKALSWPWALIDLN